MVLRLNRYCTDVLTLSNIHHTKHNITPICQTKTKTLAQKKKNTNSLTFLSTAKLQLTEQVRETRDCGVIFFKRIQNEPGILF